MNHTFKQSVVIAGHKFSIHQNGQPKVFSVPTEVLKHKHFKRFKKAGLIVSTDSPVTPAKAETVEERSLRLHKKLAEEKGLQKVSSDDEAASGDDSSFDDEAEAASSDGDFDDEETPKKKAKKKK